MPRQAYDIIAVIRIHIPGPEDVYSDPDVDWTNAQHKARLSRILHAPGGRAEGDPRWCRAGERQVLRVIRVNPRTAT